ncbi:MAG TPA: CDP-archaeol synthase [Kiritimatiellia bacterium]|nr:CDP-archaeol synthase [Kiritimatiellia bacterium]HRZ13127.1 CDP-archaeol synthase [Kiritimatiellia bacterium]HSA17548.1 CDP-archaeol synthase [Kiritimatiellia bacterium]
MSFDKLKYRLPTGLAISAALFSAAWWLPFHGWLVVLLAITAVALWEFYGLLQAARIPHFPFVGIAGGLALILGTGVLQQAPGRVEIMVLFATLLAVLLRQFPQKDNPRPLETIAGTLFGVLYVAFLFNFFTRLLVDWGDHDGRLLALYAIVVTKLSDVGAFFVGCAIGRHKLIPRISPAKSWEGCFGGIALSVLGSLAAAALARPHWHQVSLGAGDAVALGLLLSLAGIAGDLTESLFKRAAGVKDSGRILLGMGGLLDVLDSLLFAVPMLYVYATFFLAG